MKKNKIIVSVIAIIALIVMGIIVLLPNFQISVFRESLNKGDNLKAATILEYDKVQSGDENLTDTKGNIIDNLFVDAYFFNETGEKVRGICQNIGENAILHVEINATQMTGTVQNLTVTLPGHKNYAIVPTLEPGGFIKSVDNENGIFALNDLTGGNAITLQIQMQNAVWSNGQTWPENYSKEIQTKVTGNVLQDSNSISFEKNIYNQLDWTGATSIETLQMSNYISTADKCILTSTGEIIVNLRVQSKIEAIPNRAPDNYAEYVLTNLAISGVNPTNVKISSLDRYSVIMESEYDSVNDKLMYKQKIADAEKGAAGQLYYTSVVSIVYPSSLYNTIKDLNVSNTYNLESKHVGFGNPNITYDGTSLIDTETTQPGVIYSDSKQMTYTMIFDAFNGKIVSYDHSLGYINKLNSRLAYKNIDSVAGFIETWNATVNIGDEYISKMQFKRNFTTASGIYTGPDSTFVSSDGTMYSFEDAKYYTAIRIDEKLFRMLGEKGKVYIYDDINNELILTIEEAGKYVYGDYEGLQKGYKSIRIETDSIINVGQCEIINFIEIDNNALVEKYNETQFDSFTQIITSNNLHLTIADNNNIFSVGDMARERYVEGNLVFLADSEKVLNTINTTNIDLGIVLSTESYLDAYAGATYWLNPQLLLEMPKEISKAEIDSITIKSGEEDIILNWNEPEYINDKCILKINITGEIYDTTDLIVKIKATPNTEYINSAVQTEGSKIRTFAYSEYPVETNLTNGPWTAVVTDIYDWDKDGLTTDNSFAALTNLSYAAPTGIATNTSAKIYNADNSLKLDVLCPNVGELSLEDAGETAVIEMNIFNYYNNAVQNLKLVGKIPYKGNTFVNEDTKSLCSTFSTTMNSEGITIPSELEGKVSIYYSENDVSITGHTDNMDINDSSYGWQTAGNIADWTKIKSYLIDFNTTELQNGDKYTFSYKVDLPDELSYGMQTFATHAIEFDVAEENNTTIFLRTETNKVGLKVETDTRCKVEFTKVAEDGITELNNAKFILSRVDGQPLSIAENGTTTMTQELIASPKMNLEKLYPNVEYKLEETLAPENYKLMETPIIFEIIKDSGDSYIINTTQEELSGTIKSTTSVSSGATNVELKGATIVNEPDIANYVVEYYYQSSGSYNNIPDETSEVRTGVIGTTVKATDLDKVSKKLNFVLDESKNNDYTGIVLSDGTLKLKVYFKEQFVIKYVPGDKGTFTEEETTGIDYGTITPIFKGTISGEQGYDFNGWTPTVEEKVTANITYVATWKPSENTKYKVEFYYEENGTYPDNPNEYVERTGTTNTIVQVTEKDKIPNKLDSNYELDTNRLDQTSGTVLGDGSLVLKVYFKEIPVSYNLDVVLKDTNNNTILGNEFTITRVNSNSDKNVLYDKKEVNDLVEIEERKITIDNYTYEIIENNTRKNTYVNVLSDKVIKVNTTISEEGIINIADWKIYKSSGEEIDENDLVYDYVTVNLESSSDNIKTIKVIVKNPITFTVELKKIDTEGNPLENTGVTIESEIINEQNAVHSNENINKESVENITESGVVSGVTNNNGIVKYDETWVNANTNNDYYTYRIKETRTPGAQYVNVLEGYEIVIRVHIEADGTLILVDENGNEYDVNEEYKFTIESIDGEQVTDDLYTYVYVAINNNKLKTILNAQFENPVKYNVAVYEKIYGEEHINLTGIPVEITSGFSGVSTVVTDENGTAIIEESPVRADEYIYMITQLNKYKDVTVNDKFANILDGHYIGINLKVNSDGTIKTLSDTGEETIESYKIFSQDDNGQFVEVDFEDTYIDELINVNVTKNEHNICTLNIYITTFQKYNLKIINTDIDTGINMNNVSFSLIAKNANDEEIKLREAKNNLAEINLKELKTSIINNEDGIIEVNNIVIDKAGVYKFIITEKTPVAEDCIYKDKSEDIIIQIEIDVENGEYVLKNMQVLQGKKYTISDNTNISGQQTVQINVANERIKGTYDLVLTKLNKFTDTLLEGAVYKVTIEQKNTENKVLYVSDGNVLSKNTIIPYDGSIESTDETLLGIVVENGILTFKNIRIERPETYTIKIEEVKAPDTFTKLDNLIELEITTDISGEYDNAKYVLKDVVLKGNNNLVSKTNTENSINVKINNEYFDLSLRQFISNVNGIEIATREPNVKLDLLKNPEITTAQYIQTKQAQRVYAGQEIIYTIRVYNEGLIDGFAEEIAQYLPEGLEFVEDDFNASQGWVYNKDKRIVTTQQLSKEISSENKISAYNPETMEELDYKEVKLKLKVSDVTILKTKLTTISEITKMLAEDVNKTVDRDSYSLITIPESKEEVANYKDEELDKEYIAGNEDDDDFEKIIVEEFDLAVVKYLKQHNEKILEERIPQISIDEERMEEYKNNIFNGFKYKEDLSIENVKQNDTVIFGIVVYNEGTVPGYAMEIKDTIPKGLEFVVDSEINKKYGWVMLDEDGNVTGNIEKAYYLVSDYLSKENETEEQGNIIASLQVENGKIVIDSKEIEVEFKVIEPETEERVASNCAEVSKYVDDLNINVIDRDLEEKTNENIETVYIQKFDLELQQELTDIVVTDIENNKITKMEPNNSNELRKMAKIDIDKARIDKTQVKIEYTITVKNNGETDGYALQITNYIPEGLTFLANDNPDWEESNGVLITKALANNILKPGQTESVKLILTWNNKDNLGSKKNVAEISKHCDENKLQVVDVDSTPNNRAEGEDDMDTTDVMITVRTGENRTIKTIISISCFVLAGICFIIYIVNEIKARKEENI